MYRIRLDEFEGPLDLLLFFIRRDELDVFDIPISRIADEFLGYVRVMKQIDLDGVGDFIYMAAVLISIKARMLLPRQDADEEEGDEIDPRRELVERLLEYVRFKEASDELGRRHERRGRRFVRGAASDVHGRFVFDEPELQLELTVIDLIEALRPLLTDEPETAQPTHEIVREEYSVEEQQQFVLDRILSEPMISFHDLVRQRSKAFIVATFLAVLEMARQRLVTLSFAAAGRDFFVMRPEAEPA